MAFEIRKLDVVSRSEAGVDIPITNPATGEKTEIVITVRGKHSSEFKRLLGKYQQREANRAKRKGAAKQTDGEEGQEEMAVLLSGVTIGWSGIMEDGKDLPFSKQEAERVYLEYPLIAAQVFAAAIDDANFTEA